MLRVREDLVHVSQLDDATAHLEVSRALAEGGGLEYLALEATGHLALLETVRHTL